ncbi:MAG: molybdopterin-dependent oxidoreductase, partial [Phycisphaerales bacterium]|nr:molybdopterin-dependent oxidoreductase [Phycisphaerales bacterium]
GWKHVHADNRLRLPKRKQFGLQIDSDWNRAYLECARILKEAQGSGKRLGVMVSPMLSCEDAFLLATLVLSIDERAELCVGPVPRVGQDRTYPPGKSDGYTIYAEKAPNARGVERVLKSLVAARGNKAHLGSWQDFASSMKAGRLGAAIITGNYPSAWAPQELLDGVRGSGANRALVILLDTLSSTLSDAADVVLPSCTWIEKAGTFENARNMIQAFEQAIPPMEASTAEGQLALDLMAAIAGKLAPMESETLVMNPNKAGQVPDASRVMMALDRVYNAADIRAEMARIDGLGVFVTDVHLPVPETAQEPDMQMVEL